MTNTQEFDEIQVRESKESDFSSQRDSHSMWDTELSQTDLHWPSQAVFAKTKGTFQSIVISRQHLTGHLAPSKKKKFLSACFWSFINYSS